MMIPMFIELTLTRGRGKKVLANIHNIGLIYPKEYDGTWVTVPGDALSVRESVSEIKAKIHAALADSVRVEGRNNGT